MSLNQVQTQMAHVTPLEGCRSSFPQRYLHIQAVLGRPSQREILEGKAIIQVRATSAQLNGWLRELASPLEPEEKKIGRKK